MTSHADAFAGSVLDLAPGSTLGRYELLVPIAAGGMARVWAARLRGHAGFTKLVAVKMIRPELAEDQGFQQMFLDEARIASMVRHANVCETYDLAETDGILYLAMEWVEGASLQRLLRDTTQDVSSPTVSGDAFNRTTNDNRGSSRLAIEPRVAARIMADACAGLHAAHELTGDDGTPLGVIHRDATPHNILVSSDGRVKVSDFGVAKALGQMHATLAGQVKGKIAYMAPEQLCGDPMDRRADIFALGACLYEAVVGRKAFVGENDPETMSKIMLGAFDPPEDVSPHVPPQLSAIIMRALAAESKDRFSTAEEMQMALEQYIAESGPPVLASAVAAVVKSRCSAEIEKRRATIRTALMSPGTPGPLRPSGQAAIAIAMEEPVDPTTADKTNPAPPPVMARDPAVFESQPGKSDASVRMNGAVDLRRAPPRESGVKWMPMVAIAAVVALLSIGAGSVAILKLRKSAAADVDPRPIVTTVASASQVAPVPSAPPSTSTQQAAPSPRVSFALTPDTAVLVVDGVVLPRGITVVQRRTDGIAQSVLVRADKYEDYVVLVDNETPENVEVTLTPLDLAQPGANGTAPKKKVRPRASASASGSAAPPGSAIGVDTPPNPYGNE